MPDILLAAVRTQVLNEINGDENKRRKNESLRRFDIYKKRQAQYIKEQLLREYSGGTVAEMRVISSINLCPRIVDKCASLYVDEPKRTFTKADGKPVSDQEQKQLEQLYLTDSFNDKAKKSNRYYNLQQQAALQIIPRDGIIQTRVLQPHHYDVIPMEGNPEVAEGYVISVYDRSLLYNRIATPVQSSNQNYLPESTTDQINQVIADPDDQKSRQRYIWWTKEYNFVTDGWGRILTDDGQLYLVGSLQDIEQLRNPIGRLPFVDIATGKEYEFWVRQGSDTVDFALDFGVLLSDTAEINKLQGYSQAILYSEEPPKDMIVGPHRIIHIKQNNNKELQPKFEFASTNADIQASLDLLEKFLSMFLTSKGLDPKMVSGRGEATKYTSGLDRLLAMIDLFEASKDDISLYRRVEQEALDIKVAWSNLMQGATIQGGVQPLNPELRQAMLPEGLKVTVAYCTPEATQSQTEIEDSQIKLLDNGLTTKKNALMVIHKVDEEKAEQMKAEIDAEFQPPVDPADMPTGGENPDPDDEDTDT